MEKINLTEAYTYNGVFHAGNVFGAALLEMVFPKIVIHRVNRLPKDKKDAFFFDLGKKQNRSEYTYRNEEGKQFPYGTFGKLLRDFGPMLDSNPEVTHDLDTSLARYIDEFEIIGSPNMLSNTIVRLNPVGSSLTNEEKDKAFNLAVYFAKEIIKSIISRSKFNIESRIITEECLGNMRDNIVTLPRYLNWQNVLTTSPALFVIMPANRGGFDAYAIPAQAGSHNLKCPFATEYCGLSGDEIHNLIHGLDFVHRDGFIAHGTKYEAIYQLCLLSQQAS